MYCRKCGRLNDDNFYECLGCGEVLPRAAREEDKPGVAGANQELQRQPKSKSLESLTIEGESPVDDSVSPPLRLAYQSSAELVELRAKQGGPPSKAKYSITTDSEPVGRLKDEKHPF